jgi:hypothetical protein
MSSASRAEAGAAASTWVTSSAGDWSPLRALFVVPGRGQVSRI